MASDLEPGPRASTRPELSLAAITPLRIRRVRTMPWATRPLAFLIVGLFVSSGLAFAVAPLTPVSSSQGGALPMPGALVGSGASSLTTVGAGALPFATSASSSVGFSSSSSTPTRSSTPTSPTFTLEPSGSSQATGSGSVVVVGGAGSSASSSTFGSTSASTAPSTSPSSTFPGPLVPSVSGATLVVVPGTAGVGSTITFQASGFTANSLLSVTWAQGTACTGSTNGNGDTVCGFNLPPATSGLWTFTGTDGSGVSATTTLQVYPTLTSSSAEAAPGSRVTFSGLGFGASQSVTVSWPSGTACSATTTPSGAFTCAYVIPGGALPTGYAFIATDAASNTASVEVMTTTGPVAVISPVHGPVGTNVQVQAAGLAPYVSVTVKDAGGSTICSSGTDGAGRVGCGWTLGATPAGSVTYTVSDSTGNSTSVVFHVDPTLTSTTAGGPPGTLLSFSGTGFAASSTVTLTWTGGTVCTTVSTILGSFGPCAFTIPLGALTGDDNFTATDAASDQAGEVLQVSSSPQILVGPGNASVGTSVGVYGSGFAPSSAVQVSGFGGTVCGNTADAFGNFNCGFTVPSEAFGPYTLTASDGGAGHTASSRLLVTSSLALSRSGVGPGGTETLTGTGFGSSSAVSVVWGPNTVCSPTASTNGGFQCMLSVPLGTVAGSYVVNATDAAGHTAGIGLSVLTQAFLTVAPSTAPVGSSVTFNGGGFAPGSSTTGIYSWVGGICGVSPAADGTFSTTCNLPNMPSGGVVITASDDQGDIASTTFYATPTLSGSTHAGPVGTPVVLTAQGLHGNSSVSVSWSPGTACSGFASRLGDFSCSFTIPSGTASGPYVFTAVDGQGGSADLPWTVTPPPAVAVSASQVTVGESISFFGSGFVGGAAVSVSGLSTVLCSTTAGALGSFQCGPQVPATPPGSYPFTATDSFGNSATGTLLVLPSLSVSPGTAGAGSTVAFQGTGFAVASAITLSWVAGTACATTSDGSGDFQCTVVVPGTTSPGTYAFNAKDAAGDQAPVLLTVGSIPGPGLELTTPGGLPGSQEWFNGSGFASGSAVTVTGGGTTLCTATSDAGGSFSCQAGIPGAWTPGSWAITAEDASGGSAAALFQVLPAAHLMLEPGVLTPGSSLNAFGEGFVPGSDPTLLWSGGGLCGGTVNGAGQWSCGGALPLSFVGGSYTFTVADPAGHTASSTALVVGTLVASISGGPPGSVVQFSGDGYAASTTVTVAWSAGTACSGTSESNGHFVCAFTLPPGTSSASYGFTASDGKGDLGSTSLYVAPAPVVLAAPSQGDVGASITFTVAGFLAGSTVTVSWGNGDACSTGTNGLGYGSCGLAVPNVPGGPDLVTARDPAGNTATATYVVVPQLTESVSGAAAGSGVLFQGQGFSATSALSVTYALGTACSTTTDTTGSFSCQATIAPATSPGTYVLTAEDASSHTARVLLRVTGSGAFLTATPAVATPGGSVQLVGNGFASNLPWYLTALAWAGGDVCQPGTGPFGSFSCGLTIPGGIPGGPYTFSFSDGEGHLASAVVVIAPSLQVSSTTAPTGDTLVFSGSSFPASVPVTVSWSPGTACAATTDNHGAFSCTLVVPGGTATGRYTFDAAGGGVSSATSALVVGAGSFQLVPSAGPEGTSIFSSGDGFLGGSPLTVLSSQGVACNVYYSVGPDGGFTCGFSLSGLPAGAQVLTARDGNGDTASATFTVVPELALSLASGGPGTSFVISGTGYAASSTVTVTSDLGSACTATSDRFGSFSCVYSIGPTTAPGSHGFTARDASGNVAGGIFLVSSARALAVTPPSGQAGSSLTFQGSGFATSSPVAVTWSGGTACSTTSSAQGAFSCTFAIPAGTPAGSYGFQATDGSGGTASTTFTVVTSSTPSLSVNPSSGPVGAAFDFAGSGFAPSSSVGVSWSGGPVCGAYTTPTGTFSCSAVVPPMPAGSETFTALDSSGLSALVAFTVNPHLRVSPTGGPGGTPLAFQGTGFASSSTLTLTWSGGTACTTTTDSAGSFLCFYTLPLGTSAGSTTFTATDGSGNSAPVVFLVTGTPALSTSPNHGPVGTAITLSGSGFSISSSVVVTMLGNVECTLTTDAAGAFSCGFDLPPTPAGGVTISATDGLGNSASTTFTVDPALVSSVPGGPSGIQVVFTGSGYAASSPVTVSWVSGTACASTTGIHGSFTCSYVLPLGTTLGSYAFTATDAGSNTASLLFEATGPTGLTESTTSGPVGTSVTFSASGLVPNVPYYSGGLLSWAFGTVCYPGTSSTGTFSCTYVLPPVPHGAYVFTAVDGYGDQATQTFTVTSSLGESVDGGPIGTPVLFRGTGFAAGSAVTVAWTSGTACTATTDTGGTFGCTFSIPAGTPVGSTAFTATDAASNTATVFFQVTGSPTLTPNVGSGPVGTSITLSASGLVSSDGVGFYWIYGPLCSGTTSATGTASCSFTLPATPAGMVLLVVEDAYGDRASTSFTVTSSLSVSPAGGPAGTTVVLSGSGFAAITPITVTWTGGGGNACTATSGGLGSFLCTFLVPVGTAPGSYTFTATDSVSNSATAGFSVTSASTAAISLSATTWTQGMQVLLGARGFALLSSISVAWTPGTICSGTTDGQGDFSCGFVVGAVPYGSYTLTATDGSGNTATTTVQVDPQLVLSSTNGLVGSSLTTWMSGFSASSSISLSWTKGTACSGTTTAAGTFGCGLVVPAGTSPGYYTFTATDGSGHAASATYQVVAPHLALSPSTVPQGGTLVLTGTYFAASSTITVTWSGGTACTATSDAEGEFLCSFTVPLSTVSGSYGITATDGSGNSAGTTFNVMAPYLAGTPGQGPAGTSITFALTGFAASSPVQVTWSGGTACAGTTGAQGSFTCTFVVPLTTSSGGYTFTAADAASNSATFGFTVTTPSLSAVPPGGPSGTVLTIEGKGFSVSSTVTVTWPSGTACTATSTPTGSFSCTFTFPAGLAIGAYGFTATDAHGAGATLLLEATGSTTLLASVTVATPGTSVTFYGTGFVPGAGIIIVGPLVSCGTSASATGTFSCGFTLPDLPYGTATFTATDGWDDYASTSFLVVPVLSASVFGQTIVSAPAGTTITFSGAGFTPSSAITLTWDGGASGCTSTTDPAGVFSCTWTVPSGTVPGSYGFTAVDGAGHAATLTFDAGGSPTLEVTPLVVPAGTAVQVGGSGLLGGLPWYDTWVNWTYGTICQPGTSSVGEFGPCGYTIPAYVPDGRYGITATDAWGDFANTTITVGPTLTSSLPEVDLGYAVTFTGAGFSTLASVTLSWSGGTVCALSTTPQGSFSCTFTVPGGTALGGHAFVATDANGRTAATTVDVVPSPELSATPSAALVGSSVSYTGAGFAPGVGTSVTVSWSFGVLCTVYSSGVAGEIGCSVTVPTLPAGTYLVSASDALGDKATTNVTVVPSVSVAPSPAGIGATVTVAGTGFSALSTVSVQWVRGALCSSVSGTSGTFSCSFTVPVGTPGGSYDLVATDGSGLSGAGLFSVSPGSTAALSVSPTGGPAGLHAVVSGTGFAAGSPVTVAWSGGTACTATTDTAGSFTCVFPVPLATAPGTYGLTATDGAGDSAASVLDVTSGASTLVLSVPSGTAGRYVTATGEGFAFGSSLAVSAPGWGVVCSATVSSTGTFGCSFSVPAATGGSIILTASDTYGDSGTAPFSVVPSLALSLTGGAPGTTVSVQGSSFAGGSAVTVLFDGAGFCSATTDAHGAFSCSGRIPAGTPVGGSAFVATDAAGNSGAVAFYVSSSPVLLVLPLLGPVGTSLDLVASGFAAGAYLTFTWSQGIACQTTAGATGQASCSFHLPDTPAGATVFTAADPWGDRASATFSVYPTVSLSVGSGPTGTSLTVTGRGFAGSAPATVWGLGASVCSTTTTPLGDLSCTFVVPAGWPIGSLEVMGSVSGLVASAAFFVTASLSLALSPSTGPVGTTITFVGSGFLPGSGVGVDWLEGGACGGTADTRGSFSCTFTLPDAPAGATTFLATDGNGGSATATFSVTPSFSDTPTGGPVGTLVTFRGTGFAAVSPVTVSYSAGTACTASTDSLGNLVCTFTVPSGTAVGSYIFTATDGGGNTASTLFGATGTTTLSVSPTSATVGASVGVSGTGFAPSLPYYDLTVSWAFGVVCTGAGSTSTGTFSCTFSVPTVPAGSYLLTATDVHGNTATATLTVTPTLFVSPAGGPIGSEATFRGEGFHASSAVTVSWTSGTACTGTTDLDGVFSCVLTVPAGTATGGYTFTATDGSGGSATVSYYVTGTTLLTSTLATGPVGSALSLSGTGFTSSEGYTVLFQGGGFDLVVCSSLGWPYNAPATSPTGTLSCTYTVPAVPAGSYTFTARDAFGISAAVGFTVTPSLVLSAPGGDVGAPVKFSGYGFAASSSVMVAWSAGTACTATSAANGTFSCAFSPGATPGGSYTFTATDSASNSASGTYVITTSISLAPDTGQAGSAFTVTGTGFANAGSITVTWSGGGTLCTATASSAGSFTCSASVPAGAGSGSYTVSASDGSGHSATAGFRVSTPSLTVSSASGAVGIPLTFAGTAFTAGSTYTLTWSGGTACSGTLSGTGTFSCSFTIPTGTSAGGYTFAATDGASLSASVSFTVTTPGLGVSLPGSPPGVELFLDGVGFSPGVALTVTWAPGTACSLTTSSLGTFTCAFVVPGGTSAGTYAFTATDAYGAKATVGFTVTGAPGLTLSPTPTTVGSYVSFTAGGFVLYSTVAISWTGGAACGGTADGSGSLSCSFTVPAAPAGIYTFRAADPYGDLATATLQITPALYEAEGGIPITGGPVGSRVTFSGTAFGAGRTATVSWPGGTACTGTVRADGDFTCSFTIPPGTASGSTAFTANDGAGDTASVLFEVTGATTTLTASPSSGPVGTSVTFTGNGFAATLPWYETSLDWYQGGVCNPGTSSTGSFTCGFGIPQGTPAGTYTFTASDAFGDRATTTFTVVTATLTASLPGGPIGTSIDFTGKGYAAVSALTVSWSGGTACSLTTDRQGDFSCVFIVPAGTSTGTYAFTAADALSNSASVSFVVTGTTSVTVTPTVGPGGTSVTFSGTGFVPNVPWWQTSIWWAGGTACQPGTDGTGSFSCGFTIPTGTAIGTYTFTAVDGHGNSATASFTVQPPVLTLSPTGGPPGTTVVISGTGYLADSAISVSWTGGPVCSSTTDRTGSFGCDFVVPAGTAAGSYTLTAVDGGSNSASATFGVVAPATLVLSPTSATVGTFISLTASGFVPGAWLTIGWSGAELCYGTVSPTGGISCSVQLGDVPNGPLVLTAADSRGTVAQATLQVLASLSASPGSAPAGGSTTLIASGFSPFASLSVTWTGGTACSGTTDGSGTLSCPFTVPAGTAAGTYTLTATDGNGVSASTSLQAMGTLSLSLSPGSGTAGATVTVTGAGFAPLAGVTAYWGDTAVVLCYASTSAAGAFSCTFTVPNVAVGSYPVVAPDGQGDTASATLLVLPSLTDTPSFGPAGTSVVFAGEGFAAFSSLALTWSGGTACTTSTDHHGDFPCSFTIPSGTPGGAYTFTATDGSGNTATVVFTLTALTLSPTSGAVGTSVLFSAAGFHPSSSLSITWSGGTICSGTTTVGGSFSCTAAAPASPPGGLLFTATDGSGTSASATFTIVPALGVWPSSGVAGRTVFANGTGFAAGSAVTVTYDQGTLCSATTDAAGSFSCSGTFAADTVGPHTLTATDASSNSATGTFTVVAALSAAPPAGPAGTVVTFSGTGFDASSPVTVSWTGGTACTSTASSVGSFSCAFTIPGGTAGGAYVFTATDASSVSASFTFQVSDLVAAPSSGPVGTSVSFTATGFAASSSLTISWSGGTACSGTTSTSGSYSCSFGIPGGTAPGPYTFTATDGAGDTGSAVFTVTPTLALSPGSGPIGTTVTFTGSNFAPASTVTVTWPGGTACSATASAAGAFTCSFAVPSGTVGGSATFTATDGSGNAATATFTVTGALAIAPAGGASPGTLLTLTGSGFGASDAFAVTWAYGTVCSGTTTATGTFTCTYPLPPTPAGTYAFSASDAFGSSGSTTLPVVPALSVSPTSGTVGTLLTFRGAGYAGGSSVTVSWSGGSACSTTTNVSGSFTCTFTLPATPAGSTVFTGTDGASNAATATFLVTPRLTLSPTSGAYPATITTSGTGFAASSAVTVTAFGGTACTATSDAQGSFSCSFPVASTPVGSYPVTATDAASNTASASLYVRPGLSSTPANGPVGSTFTLAGTGFAALTTVTLTSALGGGTATTDASGAFSLSITVPAGTPGGTYSINATDASGDSAVSSFLVMPSLTVSPIGGPAGTVATFSATGFPASLALTLTWSGGTACSGTTTSSGTFGCTYTIPGGTPGGPYLFSARTTGSTATATFTVTYLSASPAYGPVGTAIAFTAGGYAAISSFSITWSGGTACIGTTTATGTFACSFSLPATPAGAVTFTGTDGTGTSSSTTFTVTPQLTVSPTSGPVGTLLTFTGSGFAATSAVSVAWSGGTACSATTGATGAFTCTFTLTAAPAGSTSFTATDASSNAASATFTVTPSLAVSPTSSGLPAALTFTGAGYAATSTVTVAWSGGTACTATTTAAGAFSCSYTLTAASAGALAFTGTDAASNAASTTFTVLPSLSVSPGSGPVGSSLTFSGTGFAASSAVTVSWSGGTACSATSSALGSFSCTFTLTAAPAGSVSFTATDAASNAAGATFTVLPSLSISPGSGPVGTSLVVAGEGFAASSAVTVTGSGGTVCTTTSGADGAFSCSFVLSAAPAGALTLSATDASSDTASGTFTVLSSLTVSPTSGGAGTTVTFTGTGFGAGVTVTVRGSGGTACSGTSGATGSFTCSFLLPTSFPAGATTFTASDPAGDSATATFTVFGTPGASAPTPSVTSIDVGGTVTFTTTASGGSGAYSSYAWTESGTGLGCALANAATITCVATVAGNYTVAVTVTDSNGMVSPSATSANFPVFPLPGVGAPVGVPASVDVGQGVNFTASAWGGSGGAFTYTWTESGAGLGCTFANAATMACVPTASGSYTVSVTVKDADGGTSSTATSSSLFVSPALVVPAPTATPSVVDVGGTTTLTAGASGGAGGYTYSWSGLPGGCTGSGSSFSCAPSVAGTSTISVTVTDGNGRTVTSAPLSLTVNSPVSVTASVTPTGGDTSTSFTFRAVGADGTAPLTYAWKFGDRGSGTGASATHTFGVAGTYTVRVWANDSAGGSATTTVTVTVSSGGGGGGGGGGQILGLPTTEALGLFGALGAAGILAALFLLLRGRKRGGTTAPAGGGATDERSEPRPGTPSGAAGPTEPPPAPSGVPKQDGNENAPENGRL